MRRTTSTAWGVLARLRAEGRGVLAITHDPALAALADRVLCLDAGRLELLSAETDGP